MTREEGVALAQQLGSLFLECSAKTRENVEQCFEELALKVICYFPTISCAVIRARSIGIPLFMTPVCLKLLEVIEFIK